MKKKYQWKLIISKNFSHNKKTGWKSVKKNDMMMGSGLCCPVKEASCRLRLYFPGCRSIKSNGD